jgi:hypothetical protein
MEQFDTGARIAVLENEVKNIAKDIKEIRQENKDQHNILMAKMESMDKRLGIVERWRWMVVGGALVVGWLVSKYFA